MFKFIIVLSALVAASVASPVVSGDYGSVGVQTEQTVRGPLNTLSSYSKAINTAHSQAYVSRTDYTSNPAILAGYGLHPAAIAPVAAAYPGAYPGAYHAPLAGAYHAPIAAAYPGAYAGAYHAPLAGAYHAPLAAAYHAPLAGAYYH